MSFELSKEYVDKIKPHPTPPSSRLVGFKPVFSVSIPWGECCMIMEHDSLCYDDDILSRRQQLQCCAMMQLLQCFSIFCCTYMYGMFLRAE